ncbi:MAG TPA: DNA repair protein RecO [Anaerolineae bacterium]|nr:DNA repair protein RecO [Anaerolineae bacterium]
MSSHRERVYRTRAIILKRREQGEADRVITLFTPEYGKRVVIAKGVRKPTSRKAGHLEPFTHVALLLAKGKTWDIITSAQTITSFRALREDLDRTAYAYYFCELLDAFVQENDPHPELYDLLLTTFRRLETTPNLTLTARWYELALLKGVGFAPQLFHCIQCGKAIQPELNYFSLEGGGVLCPQHGEGASGAQPLPLNALKVLRYLQTQPYNHIIRLQLKPGTMRQVEKLMGDYLRFLLERRLKSPTFIRQIQTH